MNCEIDAPKGRTVQIAPRETEKRLTSAARELAKADAALRRFEIERELALAGFLVTREKLSRARMAAVAALKTATETMISDGARTTAPLASLRQ